MPNWTQTKQKLNNIFKGSKEVGGGVAKIATSIGVLTAGAATGNAPLTIAGVISACTTIGEGASGTLGVITDTSQKQDIPHADRFETSFHLLCHGAYIQDIEQNLRAADISDFGADLRAMVESEDPAYREIFEQGYWVDASK